MSGAYLRAGETAGAEYALDLMPERAGWTYSGLRVLELDAGGAHELATGEDELIVLPLAGGARSRSTASASSWPAATASSPRSTDFAYAPRDASVTIASERGGRFALPVARARSGGSSPATSRRRTSPSSCAAPARRAARSTTSARPRRSRPTR